MPESRRTRNSSVLVNLAVATGMRRNDDNLEQKASDGFPTLQSLRPRGHNALASSCEAQP